MPEEVSLVLRTLKLPMAMDDALRTIAFIENVSKSDIVRLFILRLRGKWSNVKADTTPEEGMVLRSFNLPTSLDNELRTHAHLERNSKSAVIRGCLSEGLTWHKNSASTEKGLQAFREALKASMANTA